MSSSIPTPSPKPALKPPPGVIPNFVNPPSQAYVTVVVLAICLAITTPVVLLRIYVRHFINRRLWWDDYSCIIAWIGLFGFAGLLFETLKYGNGVDMWNVTAAHGAHFIKLFGNLEIVARISIFFTKLSILLLFLRIFKPPPAQKDVTFYAIWVLIWFNLLYCIALVLTVLLQCVGKIEVPGHTCINTFFLLITASTINSLTDIVMLIIPLTAVWGLQMPTRRKVGLLFVFAVGILATASSIARLGWQARRAKDPNRTIVLIIVGLLAFAEHTIGIIVGCMPVFPALFRHVRQHLRSQSSESSSEKWKLGFGGSTLIYRRKHRPTHDDSNSSDLRSGDYKELDDLEHGRRPIAETRIATAHDENSQIPVPRPTVEGLQGSPATDVLVSRSIKVESYPRPVDIIKFDQSYPART